MEDNGDLYAIVGLKPGLQGGYEATAEAIRKAYRAKALVCHPDKRPDDPLAAAEFQRLQKAYDILSDEKARKAYDELLSIRKARLEKENRADSKRRKLMEDLKNRESLANACSKEREGEERAVQQLQREIERIRATRRQRGTGFEASQFQKPEEPDDAQGRERMVKVSWKVAKHGGSDFSVSMLKDIFSQFGRVEDVVILQKKGSAKQNSALVVMNSRSEVLAAMRQPDSLLSVEPLVPHSISSSVGSFTHPSTTSTTAGGGSPPSKLGNLVGNAFHEHEASILEKMRKRTEQLKSKANS